MKSILIAALCAVTLTAQAEEAKRDTIHKYTIDKQPVEHFDGSQLEGKHIAKYIIAYKEGKGVVEKHHVIYTGVEAEKAFTIEGDILVSKFLEPLIIVDDKEVSEEAMALIKSEDVASVNVFEPHSKVAKSYGEKGSKGVIMVTTKTAKNLSVATNPLVVVDGKEASYEELGKCGRHADESLCASFALLLSRDLYSPYSCELHCAGACGSLCFKTWAFAFCF